MNICKDIQELILTNYLDGEIDQELKIRIDRHLDECAECRKFAAEAKETLIVPFQQAPAEKVPAHLWTAIKDKIENVEAPAPQMHWARRWVETFSYLKLAPILAGLILFILIGPRVLQTQEAKKVQASEQGEYLASLLDSTSSLDSDDDTETPLEAYFL